MDARSEKDIVLQRWRHQAITLFLCITAGCATDKSHGEPTIHDLRELITMKLVEDCTGVKAQDCYDRGLVLARATGGARERADGVSLIAKACKEKLSAACQTISDRFRPPQKISGEGPQYTREAVKMGMTARISVKCVLGADGVLRNCKMLPPKTNAEKETLEATGIEKNLLDAIATYRYAPATFDGEPCEIDFLVRTRFVLR